MHACAIGKFRANITKFYRDSCIVTPYNIICFRTAVLFLYHFHMNAETIRLRNIDRMLRHPSYCHMFRVSNIVRTRKGKMTIWVPFLFLFLVPEYEYKTCRTQVFYIWDTHSQNHVKT
jgi:hypothetical protein